MGAAAIAGLSVFDFSTLRPWSKALYVVLLVGGFWTATQALLSTRFLFPRRRDWDELEKAEQTRCERVGLTVEDLNRLEVSSATAEKARNIRLQVASDVYEDEITAALGEISTRLSRFSVVVLALLLGSVVLRVLPAAQMISCDLQASVCATIPLQASPRQVMVSLRRDASGSTARAKDALSAQLESYGCNIDDRMPALAVGGDYLEPVVEFVSAGCTTGPVRLSSSLVSVTS